MPLSTPGGLDNFEITRTTVARSAWGRPILDASTSRISGVCTERSGVRAACIPFCVPQLTPSTAKEGEEGF